VASASSRGCFSANPGCKAASDAESQRSASCLRVFLRDCLCLCCCGAVLLGRELIGVAASDSALGTAIAPVGKASSSNFASRPALYLPSHGGVRKDAQSCTQSIATMVCMRLWTRSVARRVKLDETGYNMDEVTTVKGPSLPFGGVNVAPQISTQDRTPARNRNSKDTETRN
jgi:hypothetical protein